VEENKCIKIILFINIFFDGSVIRLIFYKNIDYRPLQ
jgi:hypothetical protein